jgi:heme o synthase
MSVGTRPLVPSRLAPGGIAHGSRRTPTTLVGGFIALTKPRIIELLLITTIPTMVLAQGGWPPIRLMIITFVGGTLAAGGANTYNMVVDRDIDRLMPRTQGRPLVTGIVTPRQALVFATILEIAAFAILWAGANLLSACLALSATLFYVFVYTLWLKRRTEQNIIWGGIAGCFPVLIGWAAVTGTVSAAAWVLFAVIFLWTPPHYWPLSMRYRDDYESVGVPMLSVVRSQTQVGLQTVLYAWATLACSLLLIPVAHMGLVYTLAALGAGGWFVLETHRLYSRTLSGEQVAPMRVFHASIAALSLLFLAVALDPLLIH